ncbi:TniQ family protein [Bacillus sp. JJ1127]|uniref:TniQ family protein n=1 Tax=Bacillus sp. JJ1127 TaxID=3122952 RepID=UPI002FFE5ACF
MNNFIDDRTHQNSISPLYNLVPSGLNTANSESLTSYLVRLAEAHCISVGTLFNRLIAPILDKEYITRSIKRGGNRYFDGARSLNGINSNALNLVKALEKLTWREELINLTFHKWKFVFTNRGLLKGYLSWCTLCLQEFEEQYNYVYYPLIWYVKPITCCSKHKITLCDRCYMCRRGIPVLHRNLVNGQCPYCNSSLYKNMKGQTELIKSNKSLFYAQNIGEIISVMGKQANSIPRAFIQQRLTFLISHYTKKNSKKDLGFPKVTLHEWSTGKSLPMIEKLLDICDLFDISLYEFFFEGKLHLRCKKNINPSIAIKNNRENLNYLEIEKILNNYLGMEDSLSMTQVAKEIGVNKRLLYKNIPVLCKALSEKNFRNIRASNIKRKAQLNSLIEISFKELIKEGKNPTSKNIERHLSANCLFREAFAQECLTRCWDEFI